MRRTWEQGTFFVLDPSSNALEFKAFRDSNQIFCDLNLCHDITHAQNGGGHAPGYERGADSRRILRAYPPHLYPLYACGLAGADDSLSHLSDPRFYLAGGGQFFGFFIAISLGWMVDYLGEQPVLAVALGLIAVYASAQFFSTLVEVIGNLFFTLPQGKGQVNVATRVFANLVRLPLSFHIDQRTGRLVMRLIAVQMLWAP